MQKTDIHVDATQITGGLEPFWASQIVHPTEFLLTEWGRQFLNLLKETGAARQRIRIYNQPEEAIRVSADGRITYDWSRFDEMAELILSTGLTPHVTFYGMPAELAAFPDEVRVRAYGSTVPKSRPKDYRQWETLCADFTRHVIGTYGLDQVKQWTFACWNEPDGRGFWYTQLSDHSLHLTEYLRLYDHFANGVKQVHPDLKVGGPALTNSGTFKHPNNFRMVLDHFANGVNCATNEIGSPVDFIDVHVYGTTMEFAKAANEFVTCAPSLDYMVDMFTLYARIRDDFPQFRGTPIYVTEWGLAGSGDIGIREKPQLEPRNSEYGSAFLVALVERIISMNEDSGWHLETLIFCTSGYQKVRARDFVGQRTLHTINGFHKPILNGYKLLARVASELVSVDVSPSGTTVSAFASRDADRITIAIINFQHDKIFNEGESSSITVNIAPQWSLETRVAMKHWRIDKDHSNAYTAFKEAGSPELPNPFQIDAIRKRMNLELVEPERQTTVGDVTRLEFELPCNGVSLIEITKSPDSRNQAARAGSSATRPSGDTPSAAPPTAESPRSSAACGIRPGGSSTVRCRQSRSPAKTSRPDLKASSW
jgi:xylan 1,4-beta-xylosidase